MAKSVLDIGRSAVALPMTPALFSVIEGRVLTEIRHFSTPNAENSRGLLQGVGFDPWPHWTWRSRIGVFGGQLVRPTEVAARG